MRKITVISMITLDGVMQAPGGSEEDTSEGFKYGGWTAPYSDDISNKVWKKQMKATDLLLGRKTFDIFEGYWPEHAANWPGINEVTKYVLSNTRTTSDWENTIFLKNLTDIKKLKEGPGSDIKVWGSSKLVQLLLKHNLVDELWLNTYPLILGTGKKLFEDGAIPLAFTLVESTVTPHGVIMANYKRAGRIKTAAVGA